MIAAGDLDGMNPTVAAKLQMPNFRCLSCNRPIHSINSNISGSHSACGNGAGEGVAMPPPVSVGAMSSRGSTSTVSELGMDDDSLGSFSTASVPPPRATADLGEVRVPPNMRPVTHAVKSDLLADDFSTVRKSASDLTAIQTGLSPREMQIFNELKQNGEPVSQDVRGLQLVGAAVFLVCRAPFHASPLWQPVPGQAFTSILCLMPGVVSVMAGCLLGSWIALCPLLHSFGWNAWHTFEMLGAQVSAAALRARFRLEVSYQQTAMARLASKLVRNKLAVSVSARAAWMRWCHERLLKSLHEGVARQRERQQRRQRRLESMARQSVRSLLLRSR